MSGDERADVLVVLGAALDSAGNLGPALVERVHAGVDGWKRGAAPWLMMTGIYEAAKMKARAVALGVPAERVLIEPTARTTRENALRCAELMAQHGLKSAWVVTHRYHRPRAVACFRRVGVDARGWRFSGRWRAHELVHEAGALVFYKLRGWI